jgi:DNA repair protein SbcD/Mre11
MPRFLHVADVHLGCDRYDHPQRTRDFFHAFYDALDQYAVAAAVDFVLIAGDLFEQRQILPATLNQAQLCLEILQEARIPVLAIEGNHDYRPYGTKTSWLRYLNDRGLLQLLEPNEVEELEPWDAETKTGGYVDLPCNVRVVGSRWYGTSSVQGITKLAASLQTLPSGPDFTVMMFHHGLEGQIARYAGALRYQDLLPLKEAGVDYLALGHIHKHYTEADWIFNPGSIEANSVAESQEQTPRGVYLVDLDQQGIQAQLQRDYYQRPILRVTLQADTRQTSDELTAAAIARIETLASQGKTQEAIVELKIQGQVSFDRLDVEVRGLRQRLLEISQALIFLLRYEVVSTVYETPITTAGDEPPARLEIEQQVFTDFLAANVTYQDRAEQLAKGLIDLKAQILDNVPEEELYSTVSKLLVPQD